MAGLISSRRGNLKACKHFRIDRALLGDASLLAEELVTDFFHLTSRSWRTIQYEVLTDEQIFLTLPQDSLAALIKAETTALLPHRRRDFYFIWLRESRLADFSQERDFLHALLLYIFTHELIHMVRFMQFSACFWMKPHKRWQEECLVHGLCQKVLEGVKLPRLKDVLRAFNLIYQ